MSLDMIVHDGAHQTPPMPQAAAKTYLQKQYGIDGSRLTNLSQALNHAFDGKGTPCGNLKYGAHSPLHASAGVMGVSSVTLFYYLQANTLHLIAMGEHRAATSYNLCDLKASEGDFSRKSIEIAAAKTAPAAPPGKKRK